MIFKLALMFLLMGQAPPTAEPGQTQQPAATEPVQATETGETQVEAQEGEEQPAVSEEAEQPKQKRPAWITWVILLGILVVFYLLMILPQRRRQKKHQEMLKTLKRGDKVVTNGGIHGIISRVKEETFVIKTGDKTELEIDKAVVSQRK